MCGFSGIVRRDGAPIAQEVLEKMAGTLAHRGPDDRGFYVGPKGPVAAGLAFCRLSIIDLSGGRQPMADPAGRYHIVFNGEIYNFLELRKDLESRGRKFRTRSDTEVILHLYELYGRDCVRHLRGMFAFAIWDEREKALFLARDRIGKKPLFYARSDRGLAFASEMKAILASGWVNPAVDDAAVPLYLTYQFIPGPGTIFQGIERLQPGHTLLYDAAGRISIERYWSLSRRPRAFAGLKDLKEELLFQLREATRIRMISDVPLGAFLSGGVDSSAVVAFMAESSPGPVKTFSIGFEEQDFSELQFARQIAQKFKTDHHELTVQPRMAEVLPKLAWHYDQPFADPSALPSYYVARETRKFVTVALNGDGGDESFGGYLRYQADRIFHALSRVPRPLRRLAAASIERMAPFIPAGRLGRRALKAAGLLARSPEEFNFGLFCYFDPNALRGILSEDFARRVDLDTKRYFERLYGESDSKEFLDRVFACDAAGYLPECLLVKMDIASMANSLEARSPFLDHKVMEFAASIPWPLKVRWNGGKWILKEALRDILPGEVLDRRKMGFGVPLAKWFRGPLSGFLRETVLGSRSKGRGYFHPSRVERLVEEHMSGARDHGYKLWALMMFELWAQNYLDGKN